MVALLVVLLVLGLVFVGVFRDDPDVWIGVEVGYENVEDIFSFVDEVEDYVNLVVIGSLEVTTNATKLTTVCDYLHHKELYFIPFMFLTQFLEKPDFFQVAEERWGDHFLGVYLSDEPGGRQLDYAEHRVVYEAENYSDAASKYVWNLRQGFKNFWDHFEEPGDVSTFVADYALYWFDYQVGYDTVFAEFGWNHSRQLHISLCRGAARVHDKEWGVIVTWTYRHPPYIEDPQQLYQDMVTAYDHGAQYIIVFNHPTNQTEYGLLTEDHLDSMQRFWDYTRSHPQPIPSVEVAYVLPEDYGYGFRGADDTIWGLWSADERSSLIWNQTDMLLSTYVPLQDTELDIVYNTPKLHQKQLYQKLLYWNGTTITR
ncbi:MAG: hypothetical protein ACOC6G_01430 [Thermoproteota archaeon]